MINLDSIETFSALDKKGQLAWMTKWPNMILDSFNKAKNIDIPQTITHNKINLTYNGDYNQIGICGMGGSGISGEFMQNYLQETDFTIPVSLVRGYRLPRSFSKHSLVLIVSYSGNTRETLTCLYECLERQIPVILMSSGGACVELSEKTNFPLVILPKGFEPRAAFPVLFGAIAGIFYRIFPSLKFLEDDLKKLGELLTKQNTFYEPKVPTQSNLAKQLATKWLNVVPVFLSEYLCLGMRMKGQMNENSKKMAFYDTFPEMMHNTTQSWKDEKLQEFPFHFVRAIINKDTEMKDKTSYGLQLAKYKGVKNIDNLDFSETSENLLHRLFLATFLVDYTSIYLALLHNYDPSFIDIIAGMKDKFEPELTKKFDVKSELFKMV